MTSEAAKREALLAGRRSDLEALRKLRRAAGGPYAVGDWVRSWDGHLTGEVVGVEDREGGPGYVVRSPRVKIETSSRHVVSGDDLVPAEVEDSHLAMAVDHLEYVCEELVAAGRADDAEKAWAFLQEIVEPPAGGTNGCSGCGSLLHPSGECEEE